MEGRMNNHARMLSILVLISLFILACATITGEVASSTLEPSNVLFQDDFSDSSSGWDSVRDADGMTDYEGGAYRIQVLKPDYDFWANPGLSFTDTHIEVDASKQGGPDDNDFGVICRYLDTNNFYFFVISSDGYYGIGKVLDGEHILIDMDNMTPSDHIKLGSVSNAIRADCIGSTLTLYVNGQLVDSKEDSTFTSGDVGLMAGTFDTPGTDIAFDNYIVLKP
jgi:hypothetical protein